LLDYEYTATAGQTTFSGSDNNSATLAYAAGNLIVTLNGIVLDNGSDYTATSGTSIVLASGAALNDHLAVVAFKSFTVADAVAASTGGTFAGNVAVTGNISVTGTVDGRDVAADGTKLDTNIPSSLGAAGQVLTVNPAGNAGSWVAASGGGEQTFTAGASISAGDLVSIKSNGTIQTSVGETSGIVTISGSNPLMSHYRPMRSAFNGTDKIVIVYMDHSQNIVAYVGTITNGINLSWGSKVTVASATKTHPDVCYDSNAGKFLVVWRNDSSSYRGEAAVGTVSGTSISFGSTVVWDSGGAAYNKVVYDDNAQKSMLVYQTANTGVKAVVATISGTSVSFGTALTIQNNGDNAGGYINLVYDNNANKFVAIFGLGSGARLIVLTISGTSITYGSNNDFETQIPYYMQAHFNKNLNKIVIVWYKDASPSSWAAVAGSISGTTVSLGTVWIGGNISSPSNGYDETAQKSYTFVDGGVYREFAFSGNNISALESPTKNYAEGSVGSQAYSLGFYSYAGPKLNFFLWEYVTLTSTKIESTEVLPWAGIAAENISSGATGKVTVAGGINTAVSGLTAGLNYGLPTNSAAITAIPLGGDAEKRIFGTALSATSIYIDKGNLR
jgi:hypothetical protein